MVQRRLIRLGCPVEGQAQESERPVAPVLEEALRKNSQWDLAVESLRRPLTS